MKHFATVVVTFILLFLASDAIRADTRIGIHGGHWSHHWISEDVTNERHRWVGIRINSFTAGHAYNSYRQPGFSGELWYVGFIKDWTLASNINRWQGDVLVRGSIGVVHGYTSLKGHDPDKEPGYDPYVAPGLYYQQPFNDTWAWEVGVTQFGDASLPTAGLEARF